MDGVSSNTITCITQDKKGFMWFGTRNGLNRFDGTTFRIFRNDQSDSLTIGNNSILSLQDDGEELWVGTYKGIYLYNPMKEEFKQFAKVPQTEIRFIRSYKDNIWIVANFQLYRYNKSSGKLNSYISINEQTTNLHISQSGIVWIVNNEGKLKKYDNANDRFIDFDVSNLTKTTAYNQVQDMYPVDDTFILIGTMHEVVLLNTKTYKAFNIFKNEKWGSDVQVHEIIKRSKDEFWFGTESGLCTYNIRTQKTTRQNKQIDNPYALADDVITALWKDSEGGIWLGTFFGGINYYSQQYNRFQKYFPNSGENSLSGNVVHEICKDDLGNLWVGTEDAGINKIDRKTNKIIHFLPGRKGSISYRNIHGLVAYKDELWIGTYERGLDVMNIRTSKVIRHYKRGTTPNSLKSDLVVTLYKTRTNDILIGSWNGLFTYNRTADNFTPHPFFTMQIQGIHEDAEGTLWIASYGKGVYYYNDRTGKKGQLKFEEGNVNSIPNNYVNSLYQDSKGDFWFCTESGLCKYETGNGKVTRFTPESGLSDNQVFKVLEDNNKNLWVSTANGLFVRSASGNSIKVYSTAHGLLTNQFNYNSAYKAEDGRLFFGSVKGLISFNPETFTKNAFVPPVYITGLQINNRDVAISEPNSPLSKSVTYTKKITLSYNNSNFSLDVAALSYSLPETNEYEYKMEGLEKEWTRIKRNRKIYYTKLLHGNYTFKIRGSSSGEIWNRRETKLEIKVLPPPWKSTWAYIFYSFIIAGIAVALFKYYHEKTTEKNRRKFEMLEREKEREIYHSKIEFFTNIAHEIRTPLTLIKMPLDKLRKKEFGNVEINENLNMMDKNTNRLIDLTNQLLDFRKAEANNLALNFTRTDINELLREVYSNLKPAAEQKTLNFKLELPRIALQAFVDVEAVRKILTNLLSNSIKYSDKIVITRLLPFNSEDTSFTIEVRNDGNLIPYHLKEKIFEPFYRMKETEKQPGTGIGLALSRSLAELHKGIIDLKQPEGNMNVFVLSLPIHQEKEIMLDDYEVLITGQQPEIIDNTKESHSPNKPFILLVEDNKEIIEFVQNELKQEYNILKAHNGHQALEILLNDNIQLVISDIMMPVMDGIELVKKMKSDLQYCHIPIILLTAKNTLDARIQGLEVGADAYIEKPFAFEHLQAQMSNLLTNRNKIKEYFAKSPLTLIKGIAYTKPDKHFIESLINIIYENITNMDLDVDQLSRLMNMSKPTLYRKIKALSDLSQ